ncbi:MAG: class I SAM-dependent methyltransferase [Alphaproteobacteria bacterium]|nr:class I SAM-dependent methyltransferase [Alphaproteobacteria bacterium]
MRETVSESGPMASAPRAVLLQAVRSVWAISASTLLLLRPLVPKRLRKALRGRHKSMHVKFIRGPLHMLDIEIAKARGVPYVQWYADYKDREGAERPFEDPSVQAIYQSGAEDVEICRRFGLQPHSRLHEFGVGKGRSAQHFVSFLDPGKFSGNDASENQLRFCRQRLDALGLTATKQPRLFRNGDNSMAWLNGEKVDFIWTYAVFTHMPLEDVRAVVANARHMMHGPTVFLASFCENAEQTVERYTHKDWLYNYACFEQMAAENGYDLEDATEHIPAVKRRRDYLRFHRERLVKFTLKREIAAAGADAPRAGGAP